MPRAWMLTQLDYATRMHHVPADANRMALFSQGVTREHYVEFLSRLYSFEAPVEQRWKRITGLDNVIEVDLRVRTPYLFSDLHALGAEAELGPSPNFVGIEQALGWMYVIERGRRLNAMLHRHLVRRLPVEAMLGGNYLVASSSSGVRWEQLSHALDHVGKTTIAADQIINAAQRAFRLLRLTPPYIEKRKAA